VSGRPFFINRDPIEEAGGANLYGFCGNDGIDNFDVNGNSWLSKLWDHTILKIGQQAAIDWDHGRQYVEMGVAIVAAVVSYGALSDWAAAEYVALDTGMDYTTAAATLAAGGAPLSVGVLSTAGVVGGVVGGAGAGFVSGAGLAAMEGQHGGQVLQAGLNGAAVGGITGGAAAYFSGSGYDQYISKFATGALRGGIETGNIGGALRGGLVNEVPTDLGVGSSYYNNPYVNFGVNEVRDAAQGYAIDGRVGAERSVIGSLANDAVGHLLGLVSSDFSAPTFKGGVYMYPITSGIGKWLQSNFYGAITFGNVVTGPQSMINAPIGAYSYGNGFGTPESAFGTDPAWTSAHEIDHFESQNILGAYYLPLQALSQAAGFFSGGRDAFLEQYPFKDLPYGR
jgi:hypothetical protein